MNPEVFEVCACVHHHSVSLHVVGCSARSLTTARLSTLDYSSGDEASSTLWLTQGPLRNEPSKRELMKVCSILVQELLQNGEAKTPLADLWTHAPVVLTNYGPFDPPTNVPMPGQESLWD